MPDFRPLSRTDGLLTEEIDDEILVYDESRQIACRLNRTAALIWQHADGQRSIADLVDVLREEFEMADEDLVLVTLDRLNESGLIESGFSERSADEARLSRRRFIRRVGVVGTAALALPVVESLVAPSVAAAQSGGPCAADGACYCPCKCACGDYLGSCYCGTCACESCDHQAGSCLYCSSCSTCSTCSCASCSGYCSTCYCGDQCGNCTGSWYCSTCYCAC